MQARIPDVTKAEAQTQLQRMYELWGIDPIVDLSYRLLEGIFDGSSVEEDIIACITSSKKSTTREEVKQRLGTVGQGLLILECFTIDIKPFQTPEQVMSDRAQIVFEWCSAITLGKCLSDI